MDTEKVLRAFLGNVYKMPPTEVDALLTASDDQTAIEQLTERDKARIQPLIGKFQEGVNKGTATALTNLEANLKRTYEIDSDLQGAELIEHIITTKASTGKGATLSDDDVKKHPVYQTLADQKKKEIKALEETKNAEIAQIKTGYQKAETFGVVSKKATDLLNAMNPALPGNAEVAQNHIATFVNQFKDFDYEIQGERILVMKDGKLLDDGHGNAVEFESLVKDRAPKFFEFKQNNGGANAGNGKAGEETGGGNGGYPAGVIKPKNIEEYAAIMDNSKITLADKQKVAETWEKENTAGTA